MGNVWRRKVCAQGKWELTPSFKLVVPDGGKLGGGIGLQAAKGTIRVAIGSDGSSFNIDLQKVIGVGIGGKTLLLLPELFVSAGKNGVELVEVGVTIVP